MTREDDARAGRPATEPANWAEEEVAGEHGTTALPGSLEDEAHPEIDPQTPGGFARKVREEAGEGEGVGDKVKRAAQELDRTLSGEYERREQEGSEPA